MNFSIAQLFTATDSNPPTVTWADELTAYGTVGAVIVSLALAIFGAVVAWHDKRTDAARHRRAAERAQAEQVHWWHELCGEHPLPYEDDVSFAMAYKRLGLDQCWGEVIVLENTSNAPVHEVVLHTPRYYLPRVTSFMPGELGPNSRRVFHISGFGSSLLDPKFAAAGYVAFSDAQGRRWQREKSGILSRSFTATKEQSGEAEQLHYDLLHTLREISAEEQWAGPANEQLRNAVRWFAVRPSNSREASSRYTWQQLHSADEAAFKLLQALPPRHYQRRAARTWWRWRSGAISMDELIADPHVLFPSEARAIAKARKQTTEMGCAPAKTRRPTGVVTPRVDEPE